MRQRPQLQKSALLRLRRFCREALRRLSVDLPRPLSLIEPLEDRVLLSTFTVTNTADSGLGSLRQAIINGNAANDAAVIAFAISGSDQGFVDVDSDFPGGDLAPDAFRIDLQSPLPALTNLNGFTIDGATQTLLTGNTNPAGPEIIVGSGSFSQNILTISSDGNLVHGISFQSTDNEIAINGSNNIITGSYVGTDARGLTAIGGAGDGIIITGAGNIIGGGTAAERNVISGNTTGDGIAISGSVATGNTIIGNYIGVGADGSTSLPNNDGIGIDGASGNIIGEAVQGGRNVISGNNSSGVKIFGSLATNNLLENNFIGVSASGTNDLGNGGAGVLIDGSGVNFIGSPITNGGNVISGNGGSGIEVLGTSATGNEIKNNFIGTDITGAADLGNTSAGIFIDGAAETIIGGGFTDEGNLISGNDSHGVRITTAGSSNIVIQGNLIGTNLAGDAALGNLRGINVETGGDGLLIGGASVGEGNLISGNFDDGIHFGFSGSGSIVQGNLIGADASGLLAIGNGDDGITLHDGAANITVGGSAEGEGNLISGNIGNGVEIEGSTTTGHIIRGNLIGLSSSLAALGNSANGVLVTLGAHDNIIGGRFAGEGNIIAHNGAAGVLVDSGGAGNAIIRNSIHDNGALGIDLGQPGPQVNDTGDADAGPNDLQNYPMLETIDDSGTNTLINGTLNSTPGTTFVLDFYASDAADPSGFGEGQRHIGSVSVTTDANGNAEFGASTAALLSSSEFVTATATSNVTSSTSEFSEALNVQDGIDAGAGTLVVSTFLDNGAGSLREAIRLANATTGEDTITLGAGTYELSIAGTQEDAAATGDLDITDSLTIIGAGAGVTIIDANTIDRVFETFGEINLTLIDLTITGGAAGGSLESGGGVRHGSTGLLSLDGVTVSGNSATGNGGGIHQSAGGADITGSLISSNTASGDGGGIFFAGTALSIADSTIADNTGLSGGGLRTSSPTAIVNTIIDGNSAAGFGGGIYDTFGQIGIAQSAIINNTATAPGGGIRINPAVIENSGSSIVETTIDNNTSGGTGGGINAVGNVSIALSTISNNQSGSANPGGGLYVDPAGDVTLINSTVSTNNAGGFGGGIFNEGTLNAFFATIVNNTAGNTSAGLDSRGTTTLFNSILANNLSSGAITSNGFNLIEDTAGLTINRTGSATDVTGLDPLLGPLQDNGGLTFTHAILAQSPAIDAADPLLEIGEDQRGEIRPQGNAPDIGAFESSFVGPDPAPLIEATKGWQLVEDVDESGDASPGDILQFTITMTNTGAADATGVTLTDAAADPNYTFLTGSVTTSQGVVTTGNGAGESSVLVDLGTLEANGGAATITFEVALAGIFTAEADDVANQGFVSGDNFTTEPTDDPTTAADDDVTLVFVNASPEVEAFKVASLHQDTDESGNITPGDIVRYEVFIENFGNQGAGFVTFTDSMLDAITEAQLPLVVGSVTTTLGSVVDGNTTGDTSVQVDVGTLATVGTATITFDVLVPDDVSLISNQGFVSGSNFTTEPTDDPSSEGADDDATAILVNQPASELTVTSFLDDGEGSLREAIIFANSNPGADTISLGAGTFELSIAGRQEDGGESGDLDVTDSLTIVGQGAGVTIIDANQIDRVFEVFGGLTNLTLRNLTITGGETLTTPTENGGGIRSTSSGNLRLEGVNLVNNVASGLGGGAFVQSSITVIDSNISNNTAGVRGGGIFKTGSGSFSGSTITGNTAGEDGGGIYSAAALAITNSTVSANTASDQGGGLYTASGTEITSSQIVNNTSATGGGIFSDAFTFFVTDSQISGNVASDDGGGISHQVGGLTVSNSSLTNNASQTGRGGGILSSSASGLTLNNITFNTNTAFAGGGGLAMTQGSADITASSFTGNSSSFDGGAIEFDGTLLEIATSTFSGNVANDDGGAIYADGPLNVTGSLFSANTATNGFGGAITDFAGEMNIAGSRFFDNVSGSDGGAILTEPGSGTGPSTITESDFADNQAGGSGGGIWNDGNLQIVRSVIRVNTAGSAQNPALGGGIYNTASDGLSIVNTTISGNTVTGSGAGLYNGGSGAASIAHATIVNNAATGQGGGIFNTGSVALSYSILANNTASSGNDVGGGVNSQGFNLIEDATGLTPEGTDIVGLAPLLGPLQDNGGPTVTHAPSSGSPVIDAATSSAAIVDQRGVARPIGAAADIGAFESPFGVVASGADLTVNVHGAFIGRLPLSETTAVPGDRVLVQLDITNIGNHPARGTADIELFLSSDTTFDGSDILLETLDDRRILLGAERGFRQNVYVTIPGGISEGTYHLVARITPDANIGDGNSGNNTDAGDAFPVALQFGNVDGRKRVNFAFTDDDGTTATFILTGPGSVNVDFDTLGPNLLLEGTTELSSLRVVTDRGGDGLVQIGSVFIQGTLASFAAGTTILGGDFEAPGGLRALALHGTSGDGHQIDILTSGEMPSLLEVTHNTPVTLNLGNVTNTDLNSQAPILSLTADQWVNTTEGTNNIIGVLIAFMNITGDRAHEIEGDFEVNLTLTGSMHGRSLGAAVVAGDVSNANWQLANGAGIVSIRGDATNWTLDMSQGSVASLRTGVAQNVTIDSPDGRINSIIATRWDGGGIIATSTGLLRTTGDRIHEIAGDFNANLLLNGEGVAGTVLASALITGGVQNADWDIFGRAGGIRIAGFVDNFDLDVKLLLTSLSLGHVADANVTVSQTNRGGVLGRVIAQQWETGSINAGFAGAISITGSPLLPGNFGANVNLTDTNARASLGLLSVAGQMAGNQLRAVSSVGAVVAGSMNNAAVLVGMQPGVSTIDDLLFASDPAAAFANQDATLGRLIVTGRGATEPSFVASHVLAWQISAAALVEVSENNGESAFGFGARLIRSLATREGLRLVNLSSPDDSVADGDFNVHIIDPEPFVGVDLGGQLGGVIGDNTGGGLTLTQNIN